MSVVSPLSNNVRNRSRISERFSSSRLANGSSMRINLGCCASARAKQGDSLAFSAGKLVELRGSTMPQADAFQQGPGVLDSTASAGGEGDLIQCIEMRKQGQSLEHQRHFAPFRRNQHFARPRSRVARNGDVPAVRRLQSCNQPQQRRLAASGRAQHREALPGRQGKTHVVQHARAVEGIAGRPLTRRTCVHAAAFTPEASAQAKN